MSRQLVFLGVLIITLVSASAGLITEAFLYSQNTLLVNGNWSTSKAEMRMGVMGAKHFVFTRNALRMNRLNLGDWHSNNEVLLNDLFEPKQLEFRLKLEPNAYLISEFNRDDKGFLGIRISRNDRFPSAFIKAKKNAEFTSKTYLPIKIQDSNWHDVRIELGDPSHFELVLDGEKVYRGKYSRKSRQTIGFRNGGVRAYVDDVHIVKSNGEEVVERFRNERHFFRVFANSMLIFGAIWYSLYLIVWIRKKGVFSNDTKNFQTLCSATLFQLVFLVILGSCFTFDFYFWSNRYLHKESGKSRHHPGELVLAVERCRKLIFNKVLSFAFRYQIPQYSLPRKTAPLVTDLKPGTEFVKNDLVIYSDRSVSGLREFSINDIESLRKPANTFRQVFIGSSQTAGEGAELQQSTFVGLYHSRWSEKFKENGQRLETVNLSKRGSQLIDWNYPYLLEFLKKLNPDLVLVNYSSNDKNGKKAEFEGTLRNLVRTIALMGARTILIKEANRETGGMKLAANHRILEKVASEKSIQVIELHKHLSSPTIFDSGVLWWDTVHLTPYGHRLAEKFLSSQIAVPTI